MSSEQQMRAEIEAAGLTVLRIGALFGATLDAIVEGPSGQFMWSVYRREVLLSQTIRETKPAVVAATPEQKSLF